MPSRAQLLACEYVTESHKPDSLLKYTPHVLSRRSPTNLKLQIITAGDCIDSTTAGDLKMKVGKQGLATITLSGDGPKEANALIDLGLSTSNKQFMLPPIEDVVHPGPSRSSKREGVPANPIHCRGGPCGP